MDLEVDAMFPDDEGREDDVASAVRDVVERLVSSTSGEEQNVPGESEAGSQEDLERLIDSCGLEGGLEGDLQMSEDSENDVPGEREAGDGSQADLEKLIDSCGPEGDLQMNVPGEREAGDGSQADMEKLIDSRGPEGDLQMNEDSEKEVPGQSEAGAGSQADLATVFQSALVKLIPTTGVFGVAGCSKDKAHVISSSDDEMMSGIEEGDGQAEADVDGGSEASLEEGSIDLDSGTESDSAESSEYDEELWDDEDPAALFPKVEVAKKDKDGNLIMKNGQQVTQLKRLWTKDKTRYLKLPCHSPPAGYVGQCGANSSQAAFCEELLGDCVVKLVTNTNKNLRSKLGVDDVPKCVTLDEMYAFLGTLITMGFNPQPEIANYFARDDVIGNTAVQKAFSRRRFMTIWCNLGYTSLDDHDGPPHLVVSADTIKAAERLDPVAKVRAFMADINSNFRAVRNPSRELCVDETMTAYKGRSQIKVRMPKKPIPCGFEHFTLSEAKSGYVLNDETHLGKTVKLIFKGEPPPKFEGNFLGRVTRYVVRHYLDQGHHLAFDNRFTSADLLEFLFVHHKTTAVGSLRGNSAGMPPDYKDLYKDKVGRKERGTSELRQNGRLALAAWKDKSTLCVLSTGVNPAGRPCMTERRVGAQKLKLWCPPQVKDYQNNYKGVDLANQLSGSYRVGRRCLRWHRYFFFHKLNQVMVNAYINWLEVQQKAVQNFRKPRSQFPFRLAVARIFLARHSLRPVACRPVNLPGRLHTLEITKKSRRCCVCAAHKRRHDTIRICRVCQVHICNPDRRARCLEEHQAKF